MEVGRLAVVSWTVRILESSRTKDAVQVQHLLCYQNDSLKVVIPNVLETGQQTGAKGVEGRSISGEMAYKLLDEQASGDGITTSVKLRNASTPLDNKVLNLIGMTGKCHEGVKNSEAISQSTQAIHRFNGIVDRASSPSAHDIVRRYGGPNNARKTRRDDVVSYRILFPPFLVSHDFGLVTLIHDRRRVGWQRVATQGVDGVIGGSNMANQSERPQRRTDTIVPSSKIKSTR